MSVSEVFIRRPIATALLSLAILLAGIAAYALLPVAPLPRVDFPTISVSAQLPGASPETMASAVATPLERRFGRIAGIAEITSISSLGSTQLTLQFDLDRDVDAAGRDVQAAINAAGGELPSNLPTRPSYKKINPSDSPILILALQSDTMPLPHVYDVANSVLAQKIAQVNGVGQVDVRGQAPAVRVQVDPVALAGVGLGLDDVRTALTQATLDQPKGALGGSAQAQTLAANDQLFGAEAYRSIIVTYKDGAAVRLGDVADVIDGVENQRLAAWSNGKGAVALIVRRQPGANIIDTIDRVKALLPSLERTISPAIKINVALDRAHTIRAAFADVQQSLVISVLLVILVVFAFLRDVRATLIPSVAVPLSLVATFGAMYLVGYSLNNLSLMALTISTGFVVDDAIVVTENVARFVEAGEDPFAAALKGAKQIGFTIVSITASLLAVFIPILLMGGIVGRLFREFAVTLSFAIGVSAVVSLTLTPMMCAQLLKHVPPEAHGRLYRISESFFEGIVSLYGRALAFVLRHRHTTLAVTVGTVVVTIGLYMVVPKGLFPQQDNGLLMVATEARQDISFRAMRKLQEQVNSVMLTDPDIRTAVSFIGAGNGSAGNTGNLFMELRQRPERTASADEIIARMRPKLAKLPGVNTYLQAAQDLRVGGRMSRTQYQYTLEDADLAELRTWAPKMLEAMKKLPQLKDVASDLQTAGLVMGLSIDRDTAARLGVTPQAMDDALYDAFGQRQVATTFTQLNQYRVVLEVKPELQKDPDALDQVYVRSQTGDLVPLRTFTRQEASVTALSITHQGQFPAVTLSFNLAASVSLGDAVDAIHQMEAEIHLPSGVHADFQGTAQAFQASLANQWLLISAALVAVYIVLGVLYESTIHPITILSTLPSAGVGALVALIICRTDFSIIALIGIILLIGIVKKNAIMMIDFALECERELGLPPDEAIYKACLLRFRPILMTTLAALLGGLPLALGQGTGAELRRPLGIAIVGGLIFSQALTLFTTPVIYLALHRFSKEERPPPGKTAPSPNGEAAEIER